MILSLVIGLLFFALECSGDSIVIEAFGTIVLIPGLLALVARIWPEKERAK